MTADNEFYKNTLTLPMTHFPMKANLPKTEPERIQQWLDSDIYGKMLARNQGQKKFIMPDGPPYANGHIHVGHVLNKVLKDIIIKFHNMAGDFSSFIPGWDCHGLPIELNVTKKLGDKRAATSDADFRKMCREEALSWVQQQKQQFQRLGILADWEHPYLTLQPTYEADEVRVVAQIHNNGVLHRGEKPVYWDPALQTALAAAEVEYKTHRSPSLYVKFELEWDKVHKKFSLHKARPQPIFIVIWTTTPWTLPANFAIAVHPDFLYGLYDTGSEYLLLAQELSAAVAKSSQTPLQAVGSCVPGRELESLVSQHPFLSRDSRLILGHHVTLEAGTGCVHTAPSHGLEDYTVGLKYNLPIKSPVNDRGCFNDEIPFLKGLSIWEANKVILDTLKKSGHLLAQQEIEHQYPYGPRSKKPLIFRATPQWFIRLDEPQYNVRQKTLSVIENQIHFIPSWGIQRLSAMVSNSPDWCLSRQRIWGVPVPVFFCLQCQEPLINTQVMLKLADVMESSGLGIEAYYSLPTSTFTEGHSCSKCHSHEFRIGKDIMDVWFDSGIAHTAVQRRRPELGFPADIYIEGSDQHRGWFQTSLISSIAAQAQAPFKALVTHGFVTDAQGFKMSKSQGNVVDPSVVINEFGAEILRIWVAHEDFGDDLTISKEMLLRITDAYRRFRNTIRFMLGNLNDFDPSTDMISPSQMTDLDRWALTRFNDVIRRCRQAYEKYEFYKVYHTLNSFFTVDLSAIYLDILKDRLYTSRRHGIPRRSSQTVLYELLKGLCSLMAPITSFLSEETLQYLPGEKPSSIFLVPFPHPQPEWDQPHLETRFAKLLEIRSASSKILEELRRQKIIGSSLDAGMTITAPLEVYEALEDYKNHLEEFFIVSQVTLHRGPELKIEAARATGSKCVRCWHFNEATDTDPRWHGLCPKCIEALK